MPRRSFYGQTPNEDLSELTNYEEKSVKPIGDIAESKPIQQDTLFSSAQPFSYAQPAAATSAPSYAPTATSPSSLFGDVREKSASSAQPFLSQTAERPMVFALRSEPGAYVYEYSDRLELYRYSPFSGMMLCDKKFKKR